MLGGIKGGAVNALHFFTWKSIYNCIIVFKIHDKQVLTEVLVKVIGVIVAGVFSAIQNICLSQGSLFSVKKAQAEVEEDNS